MSEQMYRVALASRPTGAPTAKNFSYEPAEIPTPGEGEVLVRVHYMSLDPYMRGRMDDGPSYAAPVPVGGTMEAGAVGEVIASNSPAFKPGDFAFGMFGWATHGCLPATQLRKVDPNQAPITTSLGVLGMPGFTGWYGLTELGKPKAGETLVVAAATGPVGSMVGQVAKLAGLRTVGVAGGADKCTLAVEKFGFEVHEVTALFLINLVINIFFAPVFGRAVGRFGERNALAFEYVGLVIVFPLVP